MLTNADITFCWLSGSYMENVQKYVSLFSNQLTTKNFLLFANTDWSKRWQGKEVFCCQLVGEEWNNIIISELWIANQELFNYVECYYTPNFPFMHPKLLAAPTQKGAFLLLEHWHNVLAGQYALCSYWVMYEEEGGTKSKVSCLWIYTL